ncbi:hypothetical protein CY34DRAFT_232435 [Suillus luteus UH-Slu-Lm8-n1]|uniref:Uncharacterized protein n=1 Tax=Suillus luteus UH-Slu-Lm8-n1 TaxID=930992 RepID=A0A0D0AB98_9AGAM|nr:hypothetical protein CY34DRAFT_232435 [Suillus luteus UH-Slu-Lm8-n1]
MSRFGAHQSTQILRHVACSNSEASKVALFSSFFTVPYECHLIVYTATGLGNRLLLASILAAVKKYKR